MTTSKLVKIAVLCIVLCLVVGLFVDQVYAQRGAATSGDKSLGAQKGMDVLKGPKESDKPKASRLQKIIGVSSIFVMIAVVKWL